MKKLFSIMCFVLLILATSSLAFGSNKLNYKTDYRENENLWVSGLDISESSSRANLVFRDANKRVSVKGDVNIYGKETDGDLFRIELKNFKSVTKIGSSEAKKLAMRKDGRQYFEVTKGDSETLENIVVKGESASVYAYTTATTYANNKRMSTKSLVKLDYDAQSDKLTISDVSGKDKSSPFLTMGGK